MFLNYANGWNERWLSYSRFFLGSYLFLHFSHLFVYGKEIFSAEGIPGLNSFSPLPGLVELGMPYKIVLAVGLVFGASLGLSFFVKQSAFVLWLIWVLLLSTDPFITNPSYACIGLALLVFCMIPRDKFPPEMFAAVWLVMAASYSYSGFTKLTSPSWMDGSAIKETMHYFIARPGVREVVLMAPDILLKFLTWGTLALELFFLPAYFYKPLRKYFWLGAVGLHIGIVATMEFFDLSMGMLVFHFFTFNPAWLPNKMQKDLRKRSELLDPFKGK